MKTCPRCEGTGVLQDSKILGSDMRRMREKTGISLRSFAQKMKISAPYLSDLELGRRHWNINIRGKFLAAL